MAKFLMKPQTSIVRMEISPISKLDEISSAEVFIHGIPWKVEVSKDQEENSLAVYLKCTKKDNSSNWAVPVKITIKLLSFSDEENAFIRHFTPIVFNTSHRSFDAPNFIQWDDLLKDEKKYVKNDTSQMEIEITAEDPNFPKKSNTKFESIDKSCDCGSTGTFRLMVTNVENLLAVRSPEFILRGLPWDLTVYKLEASTLGLILFNASKEEVSCNVKISTKLLTFKDGTNSKEKFKSGQIEWRNSLEIKDIHPWSEILKPENGFVKDNSITLEVKIEGDIPEGDIPNEAKRRRFECSICLEVMDDQDISETPCYHVFCTACITAAVRNRKVCPLCQKKVLLKDLHRIFLSAGK